MLVGFLMIFLIGQIAMASNTSENGYYLTEEEMIEVAKAIKERDALLAENLALKEKVILLENKVNLLENTLINERIAYDTAIAQANKVIELQDQQLAYKDKIINKYEQKNKMDIILKFTLFLTGIGVGQLF